MRKLILAIFFLSICLTGAWADTVYTWTDKDGVVHMTNYPPPTGYSQKTAITSPEETREGRAFRAIQENALDRLDSKYDETDREQERNRQKIKQAEQEKQREDTREKVRVAQERRQIRNKIAMQKETIIRYKQYENDAFDSSRRLYWHKLRVEAEREVDRLESELRNVN